MKHILTTALALAFCAIAAPASAAPNPCNLVKQSEAAKALGTPVMPAKPVYGASNNECRYLNAAQNENVVVQVWDKTSLFPGEMMSMPQIQKVPQISPKAFVIGTTLYMIKHGTYVTVSIYNGPDTKSNPALIPLAKLAASRM
jgi:hypothetical protein